MYYKDNLTENTKLTLLNIIEKWQNLTMKPDESIIFDNIKMDNKFIQRLNEYNEEYMEQQIFYLNNTIELAQNKIDKEVYYDIIQMQVTNAIEWCTKYGVDINKESIYYKKNIM